MGTSAGTIAHLMDVLAPLALTSRKMFGEYALYLDGKVVALVCDDTLFLKPTAGSLALLPDAEHAPAYPGGKPWIVLPEALDDPDLARAALRQVAQDLPVPKPKAAKSRPKTGAKG